ncbi:hypothetical protein [Vibrio coralliirubri]|uniref:hypothetical protein n=1 Tax=Vibrio coralliirubri TaxID=1516159 RepID=UPI0021C44AF8|nr:hypothetical protein [Vibrio coralliirubri]
MLVDNAIHKRQHVPINANNDQPNRRFVVSVVTLSDGSITQEALYDLVSLVFDDGVGLDLPPPLDV